jgi:hypothetical protein
MHCVFRYAAETRLFGGPEPELPDAAVEEELAEEPQAAASKAIAAAAAGIRRVVSCIVELYETGGYSTVTTSHDCLRRAFGCVQRCAGTVCLSATLPWPPPERRYLGYRAVFVAIR